MAIEIQHTVMIGEGREVPLANPEICNIGRMALLAGVNKDSAEYFEVIDEDSIAIVDGEGTRVQVVSGQAINESSLFTIPNNVGGTSVFSWKLL